MTWLSHALDYQLFALNPAGHHLDSVRIHALNAVVLFQLLAWATKGVGPSLLVAALFAWHPIDVESVACVAERKKFSVDNVNRMLSSMRRHTKASGNQPSRFDSAGLREDTSLLAIQCLASAPSSRAQTIRHF